MSTLLSTLAELWICQVLTTQSKSWGILCVEEGQTNCLACYFSACKHAYTIHITCSIVQKSTHCYKTETISNSKCYRMYEKVTKNRMIIQLITDAGLGNDRISVAQVMFYCYAHIYVIIHCLKLLEILNLTIKFVHI